MNDYTEQEQIAIAKQWLRDNGKFFIAGFAILLVVYGGWSFYQYSKQQRIEGSAELYSQFEQELTDIVVKSNSAEKKIKLANDVLNQLKDDYKTNGRTLLAALQIAGLEVKRGNLDSAREQLDWAMDNAPDKGFEQLINYRLAIVESSQQQYQVALQRLAEPLDSYVALYAELEGDILMRMSQYADAFNAYQKASEVIDDSGKALLEIKMKQAQTQSQASLDVPVEDSTKS